MIKTRKTKAEWIEINKEKMRQGLEEILKFSLNRLHTVVSYKRYATSFSSVALDYIHASAEAGRAGVDIKKYNKVYESLIMLGIVRGYPTAERELSQFTERQTKQRRRA